jgi:hypothetical protein
VLEEALAAGAEDPAAVARAPASAGSAELPEGGVPEPSPPVVEVELGWPTRALLPGVSPVAGPFELPEQAANASATGTVTSKKAEPPTARAFIGRPAVQAADQTPLGELHA